MSFQIPASAPAPAPGGFSFGLPTPAGAKGGAPAAPLTGFGGFGGAAPATASIPTLTGFGTPTSAANPVPTGLLGFGTPVAAPTSAAPLTGFGGFGATPTTAAAPPSLSLTGFGATPAATAKPSIPVLSGFGATPASTATAAPAATTGFSMAKTTSAPTLGSGLGSIAAVAPTTGASSGGFANLSTATKTTDSSTVVHSSQTTYNQLEEYINKWTLELEEQEKVFTEQATQINAWDKVLINNNRKIMELNDAVHKVKNDQQVLQQELEFIATQHKELEESIAPLQKEFMKMPQVDVERTQTYLMVENLDTQLKQMSEDLKEIIDNLNEANKGQDNTDPIIQIGKILNAHMSSLQWIEASSANITNKLEDIDKMHEDFKRDSERSFRSAYYN